MVVEALAATEAQLIVLPALAGVGTHACECGHPEMRRLPNAVFQYPACGSEILLLALGTARNKDYLDARFLFEN